MVVSQRKNIAVVQFWSCQSWFLSLPFLRQKPQWVYWLMRMSLVSFTMQVVQLHHSPESILEIISRCRSLVVQTIILKDLVSLLRLKDTNAVSINAPPLESTWNFSGSIVADINTRRKFLTTSSLGRILARIIYSSKSLDDAWASSNIKIGQRFNIVFGDVASSCLSVSLMMIPLSQTELLFAFDPIFLSFSTMLVPNIYFSFFVQAPNLARTASHTLGRSSPYLCADNSKHWQYCRVSTPRWAFGNHNLMLERASINSSRCFHNGNVFCGVHN